MCKARNYTQEEDNIILELHNKGLSYRDIGKIMNIPPTSLTYHAHKLGIEKPIKKEFTIEDEKRICELYDKKQNLNEVGKIMGCAPISVKRVLDRNDKDHIVNNIEALRKYHANEYYFDDINTEDKAYFLGLLLTDGCLTQPYYSSNHRQNSIILSLQDTDKAILDKFRKYTDNTRPLRFINQKRKKSIYHDSYEFRIISDHMHRRLCEIGITPKKSLKTFYPTCIPSELDKAFIRGMIDGDGCICKKKTFKVSLVGTETLLKTVKEKIYKYVGIDCYLENCNKNQNPITKELTIKGKLKCKFFLDWLYDGATLFLDRKYNIYKDKYCENFTYYGSPLSV